MDSQGYPSQLLAVSSVLTEFLFENDEGKNKA